KVVSGTFAAFGRQPFTFGQRLGKTFEFVKSQRETRVRNVIVGRFGNNSLKSSGCFGESPRLHERRGITGRMFGIPGLDLKCAIIVTLGLRWIDATIGTPKSGEQACVPGIVL